MESFSNLLVHIQRHLDYPLCEPFPFVEVYRSCNFSAIPTSISIVMRDAVDHVWMEIEMHNNGMGELARPHVDSVTVKRV